MGDVFHALDDATRRLLLDELAARDGRTLFDLCTTLISVHGVASSRQAISQHLAVLEAAGLVVTELTVVSPDDPDGPELLLEPSDHPAVRPFRDASMTDGIPFAQFTVDDVRAEYERLRELGVSFTQPPAEMGTVVMAVLDDTCGNLIQLVTPQPDVIASTPGANAGAPTA